MRNASILAAVAFCLSGPALAGNEPCPPLEIGMEPWTTDGALPGDEYAWVYLTIGKDHRPLKCGLGQTNIFDSDRRFFVCRAFMTDWRAAAGQEPAAGSVIKRLMVIPGPHHDKIEREARKRFFQDHPEQRQECYPE